MTLRQVGIAIPERRLHTMRPSENHLRSGGSVFFFIEGARSQFAGNDEALCESHDRGLAAGASECRC